MTQHDSHLWADGGWTRCPPGALQNMLADMRNARKRVIRHWLTSVLVAGMLLSASLWLVYQLLASLS